MDARTQMRRAAGDRRLIAVRLPPHDRACVRADSTSGLFSPDGSIQGYMARSELLDLLTIPMRPRS